jgi:uncharacterized membrane protein (UPF0127 family)
VRLICQPNNELPKVLTYQIDRADNFMKRAKGLLGRDEIDESYVLFFPFTNMIHTFGMKFSIDCVFTNRQFEIIKIARFVQPNRIEGVLKFIAHVFEMKSGSAVRWNLRVGDRIYVDS